MVLEAIAAFALACNILQVVDYGARTISKASRLHHPDPESTTEYDDLEALAQQLSKLNKELITSTALHPTTLDPLQTRLSECNAESLRISQKLIDFLAKLRPKASDESKKLSWVVSFRSAIRLRWHQEEIEALQKGITEARSNLTLAFLVWTSSNSQHDMMRTSNRCEKNLLEAVERTSDRLHNEIGGLVRQMSNMRVGESSCEALFKDFQHSHDNLMSRLSLHIETILLEQEAKKTAEETTKETLRRSKIETFLMRTLAFRDMSMRIDQIREVEEGTYDWALNAGPEEASALNGFREWLFSTSPKQRMFYISGKPGAGKSTLMRHLETSIKNPWGLWPEEDRPFMCTFFLWNSGRDLQKSFQGLLQSLLYQCFSDYSWLMEAVSSQEKWTMAEFESPDIVWTIAELKRAIEDVLERISTTRKVFLLLDGLDELEGDDEDRQAMLNFLGRLIQIEGVKICVASRPWNIFNDFFRQCPTIQLQDFTRPDIEKFVRHRLSERIRVQSKYLHYSGEGENLIAAVVNKASGVFLWVRLVVEQLLRGFRDGETIRTLKRQVELMPADLDGFFQKIIDSIDPSYRKEASLFLQTTLFVVQSRNVEWPRGLIDFTFLEAEDAEFVTKSDCDFAELDLVDLEALEYRIDLGKRRLNSRCMGLLEWIEPTDYHDRLDQLLQTRVDFLHRTLVEFLLNTEPQLVLHRLTDGPFKVDLFLCNALLAKIAAISLSLSKYDLLDAAQRHYWISYVESNTKVLLRAFANMENVDPELVYSFMNQLHRVFELIISWRPSDLLKDLQPPFGSRELAQKLRKFKGSRDLPMKVAIEFGISPYVRQYLANNRPDANQIFDLFENAVLCGSFEPQSLEILRYLLEAGADPNAKQSNASSTCELFFGWLNRRTRRELSPAEVDVLELLIQYGGRMHELEKHLDSWEMRNQSNDTSVVRSSDQVNGITDNHQRPTPSYQQKLPKVDSVIRKIEIGDCVATVAQGPDKTSAIDGITVDDYQRLKSAIRKAERIRIEKSQDPMKTDEIQLTTGKRKNSCQLSETTVQRLKTGHN